MTLIDKILEEAIESQGEEAVYQSYFTKDSWSAHDFAALVAALTPKSYRARRPMYAEVPDELCQKRIAFADGVLGQFLEYLRQVDVKVLNLSNDDISLSPWRCVKWLAESHIPIKKRFFHELPLSLKELYFEFQPKNIALRTASKYHRDYHKAYYLEHAEKILRVSPALSYTEIYEYPKMQNIMRYLRDLGATFRKRTVVESWLPKHFGKLKRGRPKKLKKSSSV